ERARERSSKAAQGTRAGKSLSQGVRRGAHQPAPLPAKNDSRSRRHDRQDARQRAALRRRTHQGGSGRANRRTAGRRGRMTTIDTRPPREELFSGPTPVQEMWRLRAMLGGGPRLLVKRDDAIPFGFGGNKVRKLEFVLPEALAVNADTLVTLG